MLLDPQMVFRLKLLVEIITRIEQDRVFNIYHVVTYLVP